MKCLRIKTPLDRSYFLAEYRSVGPAFQSINGPHVDQTGLPPGSLRFILSLRATGEGHISSITSALVIDADIKSRYGRDRLS